MVNLLSDEFIAELGDAPDNQKIGEVDFQPTFDQPLIRKTLTYRSLICGTLSNKILTSKNQRRLQPSPATVGRR
jgi:hypothetical protein